jgi:hypothetical protein
MMARARKERLSAGSHPRSAGPSPPSVESLGLDGSETFDLEPLEDGAETVGVKAGDVELEARVRIDTPNEWLYYRHGGILHFVLRQLRDQVPPQRRGLAT